MANLPPTISAVGQSSKPPARLTSVPRQSTATQIKLKVIQGSIERLMTEIEELGDIKMFLTNLRNQMDEEAEAISKVTDVAAAAVLIEPFPGRPMPEYSEALKLKELEYNPVKVEQMKAE